MKQKLIQVLRASRHHQPAYERLQTRFSPSTYLRIRLGRRNGFSLARTYAGGGPKRVIPVIPLINILILALMAAPIIIGGLARYAGTKQILTQTSLDRRAGLATLAASTLHARLDELVDAGSLLGNIEDVAKLVSNNKWQEAFRRIESAGAVVKDVNGMALLNTEGTIMASNRNRGVGLNTSWRSYYKGVTEDWQPYVSEVFTARVADKNGIIIAIPIKATDGTPKAILIMQVLTDKLQALAQSINVGPDGYVYFVDQRGRLVAHPKFPPQGAITDFSSLPVVQQVLGGKNGIQELYNPIDQTNNVSAYQPVEDYGWGVVVDEPAKSVFAGRDKNLRDGLIIYAVLLIIYLLIGVRLIYIINRDRMMKLKAVGHKIEARFRKLVENSHDVIHVMDANGTIKYVSPSTRTVLGYSPSELIGTDANKLVHPDDVAAADSTLRAILGRRGFTSVPVLQRIRHKNGHYRWLEVVAVNLLRVPEIKGVVVTSRDVTDKIKAEQALAERDKLSREQNKQLMEMQVSLQDEKLSIEQEKARDDFFSVASHELRTPLTSIRGNVAMILQYYKGKLKDKELRAMLTDIHDSSIRLISIVNDFLDSSRLEQGKINFVAEKFNIETVIKQVVADMRQLAAEKKISVTVKPATSTPMVWADQNRVKQVLFNLIGNAVKFTDKGRITITVVVLPGMVKVRVTDTGAGIPEAKQKLLFRKFQQAGDDKMTRDVTRGTGLGLYISKLITQSMGGDITLESSREGVGSTFSFTLPIDEPAADRKDK